MANRITSLLKGLGAVDAVAGAWASELNDHPEIAADLAIIREKFNLLWCDNLGTRAGYALVAAMLNENMVETQRLFKLGENGKLDCTYMSNKGEIETMASLIAGE